MHRHQLALSVDTKINPNVSLIFFIKHKFKQRSENHILSVNCKLLDLVNDDLHTKFGRILSIRSQDIERKQNSDVN